MNFLLAKTHLDNMFWEDQGDNADDQQLLVAAEGTVVTGKRKTCVLFGVVLPCI